MGTKTAARQIEIESSPQECFDALIDYDTIVDWQSAAESADVLERYDDGRGKVVEWHVDAKVKKIRYRLEYHYEEPHRITWDFLEGDVKELDGDYRFEEQPSGSTLVTLTLHIDPGIWVPGKIAKMLNDQMMSRSLRDLKDRVEGLAKS